MGHIPCKSKTWIQKKGTNVRRVLEKIDSEREVLQELEDTLKRKGRKI